MKKRRTIIISFLLVATLIMGVGYAAVADKLTIGGRASFKPASAVASEVASSIYFDTTYTTVDRFGDTENVIPTLSAGFSADVTKPNSATLSVAFNGVENRENYKASVELKIIYEESASLPDVTMSVTALDIADSGAAVEGFKKPTVDLYYYDDQSVKQTITPGTTAVAPGTEVFALVTIEYDLTGIEVPAALVAGTIDISIHCDTVTNATP